MRFKELNEVSPPTFKGSLTPDLLTSKIWLCQNLKKLGQTKFSTIYILGSWYGTMAVILSRCGISFDKIINVDSNKHHITVSHKILSALDISVQSMNKDVNELNYMQLDKNSLIINTSVNDIDDNKWFDNIPSGSLVALQSRNNVINPKHNNLKDLDQEFPLSKTMFLGKLSLQDPETEYQRFMKIGTK